MMARVGIACIVLFLSLAPTLIRHSAIAQEGFLGGDFQATQPYTLNRASVLFERNQNTFNWFGSLLMDTVVAGGRFTLNEQYSSNIILFDQTASSPEKRIQSNRQQLSIRSLYPVNDQVDIRADWSSLVYSDAKGVGLSTASVHSFFGGMDYHPVRGIILSPLAGYRWDNQGIADDAGMHYGLAAITRGLSSDGYSFEGDAQFHQDRLSPRTLDDHFVRALVQKQFDGRTRDSLHAAFYRNRKEFYSLIDSSLTIDSRMENILTIGNLLAYEISPRLLTSVFVGISGRALDKSTRFASGSSSSPITFPTTIDEFFLEARLQAAYRDQVLGAHAGFQYAERSETHAALPLDGMPPGSQSLFDERNEQEQTKNSIGKRTALGGTVEFSASRSDTLALSGSGSILRYDTPSNANTEDRDELLIAMSLTSRHRLGSYLHLRLTLDGTLSHAVYLLKERSANNNRNRILRFIPRVYYRPFRSFSSTNTFEVLANYTVYDFEEQSVQIKSFSYRQFAWLDSTNVELSSRVGLDFMVYLKLYERGQLSWTDFTERPENSFLDETYAVQMRFSPGESFRCGVGFRYFRQLRYTFRDGEKELESRIQSLGPTCFLQWVAGRLGEVGLQGWYEHRSQTNGLARSLANLALNVTLNF